MQFLDHKILLVMVALASFPLYMTVARAFFGERYQNFTEALRYLIQPDFMSLRRGEWLDDQWWTAKLVVFTGLCIGWPLAVTEFLARHIL